VDYSLCFDDQARDQLIHATAPEIDSHFVLIRVVSWIRLWHQQDAIHESTQNITNIKHSLAWPGQLALIPLSNLTVIQVAHPT
jgi:hypothetical protein